MHSPLRLFILAREVLAVRIISGVVQDNDSQLYIQEERGDWI